MKLGFILFNTLKIIYLNPLLVHFKLTFPVLKFASYLSNSTIVQKNTT